MSRVVITGANGFVGRQLCKDLLDKGYPVLAVVRNKIHTDSIFTNFDQQEFESFVCDDIYDPKELVNILNSNDIFIHLAARAHVLSDQGQDNAEDYFKTNTEATKKLARLCKEKKCKQFIFMSSIGVNGSATNGKPFDENDLLTENNTPYVQSKIDAEKAVANIFEHSDTSYTIIRPPLVYGANTKGNFIKFENLVEKGLPMPFLGFKNKRSFVYLKNLTSAIIAIIEKPAEANGQLFVVSDDERVTIPHLVKSIAHAKKLRSKQFYFPPTLLYLFCRLIGKKDAFEKLYVELITSNDKIKELTGWQPPYTFEQGISEAFGVKNK